MTCIAESCIAAIVETIVDHTVGAISRELGYMFQYKRNIGNLITETQDLNLVGKGKRELVACATRNCEEIPELTMKRLNEAKEIAKQAEKFLGDENHAKIRSTMSGLLSLNLVCQRYRLSKRAKKMGDSAAKIRREVESDNNISYHPHLPIDFRNKSYIKFETRKKIVTEIMEALEDGNVRMIGVHGMPGIGKTTLVKEISTRALDSKKLFSDSVFVTVSNTPDIKQIQKAIAERLDLKLEKETIPERALLLKKRLKLEKKLLIVIDDVWNELKLEDVGIAFESDDKGCKILFTSRFERVLSTKMGVDRIFQVGLLANDEALSWFNHLVAKSIEKDYEFLRLGNDIVNECACLPIAIETIAGTLKDRELPFWRTALRQLQRSNLTGIDEEINEKVYRPIELCYNHLGDEEKLLLLLCGLHEEDESISIENLMRYGMGWGMFKDVDTLQSARDKVDNLVFKIKDRSLLLDGDRHRTVKMHDVIRDFVISIARKSHMYSFREVAEVNRLERKALEDSKAIWMPYGYKVPQVLRGGLEYKQLELIWILQNEAYEIPDDFFDKTKKLRVLYLTCGRDNVKKLPSSLSSLRNIHTLCFNGCHYVEDVSLIGGLKNLEILDFSKSNIMELPAEIGQLTRLRMLDLNDCHRLKVIQPNVISNLTSLEELYMKKSFHKWDQLQGGNGEKRNASLNELKHLDKLTTLHFEIVDIKGMPKDLFSGKTLEQYKIGIGCEFSPYYLVKDASRCLELSSLDDNRVPVQEDSFKMMLESTQSLSLHGFVFVGVDNFVYELDKAGFPKLKLFQLQDNHTVQCLINSVMQNHPRSVFRSLENLVLWNLENLEKICDGELTKESFERLRLIEVRSCNRLKNLLPFSMSKLEEIKIDRCIAMEIIVSHEEGDNSKEVIGNFPKLHSLSLKEVPRLKSFCSNRSQKGKQPLDVDYVTTLFNGKLVSLPILKILELYKCHDLTRIWDDQILPSSTSSFCSLTKLVVKICDSLEYLFPSAIATSFVQLKSIVICGCRSMKEIMRNSEKMENIMSFPNLDSLDIQDLPCLTAFSSEIYIDFPVLINLYIKECPKFSTFISKSEDEKLPSLFNEKVAFPSLKSLCISSMNIPKIITNNADVFSKLVEVDVRFCHNLRKIFTSSMQRTLGSLRELSIESCERVEEVFEIQTSSVDEIITQDAIPSQLISLRLLHLPKLVYVWGKDPRGTLTFTHLKDVQVFSCPSLKSIFPLSVAKGLSKLGKLYLLYCGIEEIVEAEGTNHVPGQPEFVFPQLEDMRLEYLQNLVCFYPGLNTSSWPSLKSLVLRSCEKVKVLASELSSFQEKHVLHDHHSSPIPLPFIFTKFDPFPNLEKLELLSCNLEKICDGELRPNSGYFRKLISLTVEYCGFLKNLFSAENFEQLCILEIKYCTMMEEIMSKNEKVDKVQFGKLSHLYFKNLPNLVSFSSEIFVEFPLLTEISIGEDCPKFKTFVSKSEEKDCTTMTSLFNDKVAFPSLQILQIEGLADLKMMWQYKLSSADSFSKLEYVKVHKCNNLVNIFPSSMQRRLHNLKFLEISDCEMVEEVFEIQIMPNVEGTYSMIHSGQVNSLKVGLSAPSMVPMISQDQLTENIFGKLDEINVYGVKSLTKMFSSNELRSLHNLRKLIISKCEMLEVVFEFQISNNDHRLDHETLEVTIPFHLTELTLSRLPKLKHVWGNDPRGTFTFQDLQMLHVDKCQCLKILFPASVAKNLLQLQKLHIGNCGIEQIVAKEEGQNQTMPTFVFPQLNNLKLHNLPKMTSFYPGLHTLKWPLLSWLQISCLTKAKDLSLRFLHFQQTSGLIHDQHTSSFQEPLFSIDEVTSSSQNEDLVGDQEECAGALSRLIWLDILRCGRIKKLVSSSISFQNLISLRVTQCHEMLSLLPSQTAKSMARLERLTIYDCKRMTAIIADTEEDGDYDTKGEIVFGRLDYLTLSDLPSLRSFYSGKYMIGFPDLERVFVNRCFEMKSFSEHGNIISSQKTCTFVLDYYTTMYGGSSIINRTILQHWESHPSTALQQLFTDKNVGYDEEDDEFDYQFEDQIVYQFEHEIDELNLMMMNLCEVDDDEFED